MNGGKEMDKMLKRYLADVFSFTKKPNDMNRISKTNLKNLTSTHYPEERKTTTAYSVQHSNPVAKEKGSHEFVVDWQVGNSHTYPNKAETKYFF